MRVLLHGVTGVAMPLLERARVKPHTTNWLHFPWYPAKRGGAFVLGERIYLLRRSLDGALRGGADELPSLLLLTHEVGHLPQAARFGPHAWGRTRFVLWATGQYARSALRNGLNAHDRAHLELEADEGRWILHRILSTDANAVHRVQQALRADDDKAMLTWVHEHAARIAALRADYRRTYLA